MCMRSELVCVCMDVCAEQSIELISATNRSK